MLSLICGLLGIFVLLILGWIVLSYVVAFGRLGYGHPVRSLYDFLSRVIEPVMRPIRSLIPPLPIGGARLDLSPLILIVGVSLLRQLIC
jgi:YggT family protein